ncbi:MAG TPA: hypothetical protein DCG12_23355 [Planctomycetaceae bacterium]|nr:hypothetical protein [Planctomycetaceae bacterium]
MMNVAHQTMFFGLLLAVIPVVLHLIMKAKPKRVEFPALRLIQQHRRSSQRRMRLRQLLLLLLRIIVIVALVFALMRPTLPNAQYGLRWYEWLILTVVTGGAVGSYFWLRKRSDARSNAAHIQKEQRARLKGWTAATGILAGLLFVGMPWGLRVKAEVTQPHSSGTPDVPVAAVFVFDVSQSMTYKHEGRTRLEHAQSIASAHLEILPSRSRVGLITNTADSETVFQADLAGVSSRMEDLRTQAVTRSLNQTIKEAILNQVSDRESATAQEGSSDGFLREVYVFSDLSRAAWDERDEAGLHDLLVQYEWLQVYLIDVSVAEPFNIGLGDIRLERESTVATQPVRMSATVYATGNVPEDAVVELFTIDENGNRLRGGGGGTVAASKVTFGGAPPVAVFNVSGPPNSSSQKGLIRLTTSDPMPFDDERWFAFDVSAVPRVLLVGDKLIDSFLVRNAMQPDTFTELGEMRYQCQSISGSRFRQQSLQNYDVVCLLNWSTPDATAWAELKDFVAAGGGLFVSVGGRNMLDSGAWSLPEAKAVLPGIPLTAPMFRPVAAQLNLVAGGHPIVKAFQDEQEAEAELSWALFERAWSLDLAEDARVLMSFTDRLRKPALVERSIGDGKVVMIASALDGTRRWSDGFVNDENWAWLLLVNEAMEYLTGRSEAKRNFLVGEAVEIDIPAESRFTTFKVARPRLRLTDGTRTLDEKSILLTDAVEPGHYELRSAEPLQPFSAVFAANGPESESDLVTISPEKLDEFLGDGRYSLVSSPEELDRAVALGRLGVEVFPVLMGLLILLYCGEHLMSNFFYDDEPEAVAA